MILDRKKPFLGFDHGFKTCWKFIYRKKNLSLSFYWLQGIADIPSHLYVVGYNIKSYSELC